MELAKEFSRNGFDFKQAYRDGDLAIYRKRKAAWPEGVESFEVIRIRSHNGFKIGGREIPAGEAYPSSEQWGVFGWTCLDLAAAKARVGVLVAAKSKKGGNSSEKEAPGVR